MNKKMNTKIYMLLHVRLRIRKGSDKNVTFFSILKGGMRTIYINTQWRIFLPCRLTLCAIYCHLHGT